MERVRFRGYIGGIECSFLVICNDISKGAIQALFNISEDCGGDHEVLDTYEVTEGILIANLQEDL